jgi:ribosomal protein S6--L-glutamate ligase
MLCDIVIDHKGSEVHYNGIKIDDTHGIIPRIGSSATEYGAAVIRQFQSMGVFTALSAPSLLLSRDKLSCLQTLAEAGIAVPRSGITNNQFTIRQLLANVSDNPYILKLLNGTQGLGVILSETTSNAESIIEAFMKTQDNILVQKFIPESKGADLRVFIVDGKIVGAMKRQAQPGEFRSNLHRGGYSSLVKLSSAEEEISLRAASVMKVDIAGIDILQSNDGPMIIEVNVSPGLEGIEATTGQDIAGSIIKYMEKKISK